MKSLCPRFLFHNLFSEYHTDDFISLNFSFICKMIKTSNFLTGLLYELKEIEYVNTVAQCLKNTQHSQMLAVVTNRVIVLLTKTVGNRIRTLIHFSEV